MALNKKTAGRIANRALITFAVGALPMSVLASEITLTSDDGTVNLVGEFLEFKDDAYAIRTGLGDLWVAASKVRCDGDACPVIHTVPAADIVTTDIQIAGSDAVGLGMMPKLISGLATHLNVKASVAADQTDGVMLTSLVSDGVIGNYHVTSTSSGDAFATLLDGTAQFGMSSRRIRPEEVTALRDSGAGNMIAPGQEHIIAVDSLVVITHPDNTVQQISLEQLRDVYSGKITNWSELGGDDAPIAVIGREAGSGTRDVFEARIFGDDEPTLVDGAMIVDDNNKVAAQVNADPTAIGFVGYAFQQDAKPLTLINECGMAMTPDAFSAKTEEYALQRRLYLYNRDEVLDASAQSFVDFVVSQDADAAITASGFIDLGINRRAQPADSARALELIDHSGDDFENGVIAQMLEQMDGFDRLSTTFRFNTGSSRLDERGAADMARLADYLATQPDGTKVRFVGFTDGVGLFTNNHVLSQGRATQMMAELQEFAGERLATLEMDASGFGELAPTACNISEDGRAINRRVEVWIESIKS
ncbi:phosphate transport system substrate-binding protein [Loktanella ponticola]|uniref:Phosphate transport system substrate-binding protein n=1 Tax=Yoonia ponticola TaxID=1524255 RepID=A0A7W9BIT7_9RHOB|nr:phosphate ABC transporter substrate-binding/OmpA family protein [Yoonia ponticola]MBB5721220.1 phosphate transport system substrate-binding protein [Yoonia ponticola]